MSTFFRFVRVALGEIVCHDKNIRDDSKGVLNSRTKERKVSETKWCDQYNIPRHTFRDWKDVYLDPKKAMREGHGRPEKFDEKAKVDIKAELRALQTATEEKKPTPASTKKVTQILRMHAKETLKRAGKTQFNGNPVKLGTSTIIRTRDEVSHKRKAHDLSNSRYQALNNTQHMFQSACLLTVALGLLTEDDKWNWDCTTFAVEKSEAGKVGNIRMQFNIKR